MNDDIELERDLRERAENALKELANEARTVADALNSTTGYGPSEPNPLVKRLLRLANEADLLLETEDE